MNINVLVVNSISESDRQYLHSHIDDVGAEIVSYLEVNKKLFDYAYDFVRFSGNPTVVTGSNFAIFVSYLQNRLNVDVSQDVFSLDGIKWAIVPRVQDGFDIIQKLVGKSKYLSYRFGIFGKNSAELASDIKKLSLPKSGVKLDIVKNIVDSTIKLRISSRVEEIVRKDILNKLTLTFMDGLYSVDGSSILQVVTDALKSKNRRIGLAESYTAGGIALQLASVPGASQYLQESIVCYSNDSKALRLGIDMQYINNNGAVSEDVAYQMAASILNHNRNCDIAMSTTGYASPVNNTSNKSYLALGDRRGIVVFDCSFEGSRQEVVQKSIQHALYQLYKFLTSGG